MTAGATIYEAGGASQPDLPLSDRPHELATSSELRPYRLTEGIVARAVHGERVTVSVVDLEPGLSMVEHRHANEQVGVVLRGEITFTIDGVVRKRVPGDMWVIPSGHPHEVTVGPDGCTVVEVFSPPRDDWEALERLTPSPGAWP
jgi:quercetin dioxygenase-like cupin family protein